MSRTLINDYAYQVLPTLAKEIGLNEALFIQQLHFLTSKNEMGEQRGHLRDGRYWVYNTVEGWHEMYPFWSERTIRRTIKNLEEMGLLITSNAYNRMKMDRTKWFAVNYESVDNLRVKVDNCASGQNGHSSGQNGQMDRPDCPNGSGQNGQNVPSKMDAPLPETSTETSAETTDIDSGADAQNDDEELPANDPEDLPAPPEPEQPKPKKKGPHYLPDGWQPSQAAIDGVMKHNLVIDLAYETEKFRDYWVGNGRKKANWDATWRNWMRKANEQKLEHVQKTPPKPSPHNLSGQQWGENPSLDKLPF